MRRPKGTFKSCIIWLTARGDAEKVPQNTFETICLNNCYHPDCPIRSVDLEKVS